MQLFRFADPAFNTDSQDEYTRKKNRDRRDYFRELLRDEGSLWVYPFKDDPTRIATIIKIWVNRLGYLTATVFVDPTDYEPGRKRTTFHVILDRLRVRSLSDDSEVQEDPVQERVLEEESEPFKAFSLAWDAYIREFN